MKTIATVFIREWKRILRLPIHYVIALIAPALLFFFFALIYQKEYAKDLPIAIWDEDHSELSKKLTNMLEQSASIHITQQVNDAKALEKELQKGNIYGAVHFPKDFEKEIKSNKEVTVTLYTNSSAMVASKLIYKDAAKVVIMSGAGVGMQKMIKKGAPVELAKTLAQPIQLTTHTLYNPTYNYKQYLVPGLITVTVQMMLIMVSALLINYEYKTNSMDELMQTGRYSAWKIIAGKTFAHLSCSWINFVLIIAFVFPITGLSHPGTNGAFFVLYTLLSLACIGIGIAASSIVKDIMTASDLALFYTSPAFVFSGFTFPRWAMPWYDQFYANLMPYTSFLDAFVKIYFMDLPLHYTQQEIGILLLFIAIPFTLAIPVLQHTINQRQHAIHH